MKTLTIAEYHAEIRAQNAPSLADVKMICPLCRTHQSANDLIAAGVGRSFEDVEKYLGFSCVGRWTGAGSPRKVPDGKPCNWTLGGLFKLHTLEVIDSSGIRHPRFEVAAAV